MVELAKYTTLDHWIVYLSLLFTLGVGLYVGKGIKNINSYAIADRTYSTLVLTITSIATLEGGTSTLGVVTNICSDGIIMTAVSLGVVISYLFTGLFIAPKIAFFEGSITMGEVMGRLYGTKASVITGIVGFLFCMLIVASQTLALGYVCESLLGVEKDIAIWIGGFTMIIYAALGGIKSVAITDVIQFSILIVVIPLIAKVGVNHVGGLSKLWNKIPAEKLEIFGHEKFTYYFVLFLIWTACPVFSLSPPSMQRMLMARDKQQASRMFIITGTFILPFQLIVTIIGFSVLVSYPAISANTALPHMVNELFSVGTKGLAVAGLLAVIMSTADSYLNSGGLLLSHDVVKPMLDKSKVVINELQFVKLTTFILGVIAIFIGLLSENLVKLIFYASSLFGSIVMIPFVAGILGVKTDAKSFFMALFVTLITFILSVLLLEVKLQYLALLFALIANGVTFFSTHLIQNRGFAFVKREKDVGP